MKVYRDSLFQMQWSWHKRAEKFFWIQSSTTAGRHHTALKAIDIQGDLKMQDALRFSFIPFLLAS